MQYKAADKPNVVDNLEEKVADSWRESGQHEKVPEFCFVRYVFEHLLPCF